MSRIVVVSRAALKRRSMIGRKSEQRRSISSALRIRHHDSSNKTQKSSISFQQRQQRRSMAIYAVGEGWTGALTSQYVLESIPGHFDEGDIEELSGQTEVQPPVCIYPGDDHDQVAVGWGITCFIDVNGTLKVVGRPHDLMSLLRLNRMPAWLRNWILKKQQPNAGQAICDTPNNSRQDTTVTPVGSAISNLIGWATGGGVDNTTTYDEKDGVDWATAQKYSYLHDFTPIDMAPPVRQVACGPGTLAMIGAEGGILYMMGVNNRGQCGVGALSNNVWTPTPVKGLTTQKKKQDQEHAMVQVALGFQHGYALDKAGIVYSWGKAQRGQLGRDNVEYSDQDATAGLVEFPNKVPIKQIAAGHHHGAALTQDGQVYLWGKNMGRRIHNENKEDEANNKPIDAPTPQLAQGLPTSHAVESISCGSHHTSILMQDGSVYAVGIASDEAVPILDAVEIVPVGIVELPVRQFEAHQDRTTVVDADGNVNQAHLWLDESLQGYAYFTPSYVDALVEDGGKSIQAIHRGWRHTVIVTE